MESITNAQLMNAIKLLTRKVENLEAEIADLKGRAPVAKRSGVTKDRIPLPENWDYPKITQNIVDAVCSKPGIRDAAAALSMTEKELSEILKSSGITHLYGEKWSVALKRAIAGELPEDSYTYPEEWFEKKEKIKAHAENFKITATAKKLEAPVNVVGRFIQLHCN